MGLFVEIVGNVLTGLSALAITNIGSQVIDLLRSRTSKLKDGDLKGFLDSLGTTSSDSIRALVYKELGKHKGITRNQMEDVAAVMISLARGATLLNTQGNPQTVYLRSEDLLKRLLSSIQPHRRAGEPVFPNDTWRLEQFLGMGAFGEVWLASNPNTKAKRAYKFFTHEGATGWLKGETERLLGVRDKLKSHPLIVQLFDVGTPAKGHPFLALEYVAGGSLEDWIADTNRSQRPIPKAELMRGIVRAVAAAHKQKIYHCDLKPANILLTAPPDIQPKITDFGVSSLEFPDAPGPIEREPILAGTPLYLPPEALHPFADRQPALYDVFALGIIWYQLLTEKLDRPSYDFAAELRDAGADSHSINLIARCLAHPTRRFPDATELEEQMGHIDLPVWSPVPEKLYDVQYLVREFVAKSMN